MRDSAYRVARWNAKFNTDRVKSTLDVLKAQMAANYEAAAGEINAMEMQVKQAINEAGVSTALYVAYLNFGRQVWKMTRESISGNTAALAAKVLLNKWAERGCDPKVLAKIRSEVFNISEPSV